MRKVSIAGASLLLLAWLTTTNIVASELSASADPSDNHAIIGGTNAPDGKWPFQVALLNAGIASNYRAERCGGSLVDKFHVVTAAHCVDGERPADLRILTGTQSLAKGGTRHRIARIKIHPNYNRKTQDYDIAVIALATPAIGIKFFARLITQAQERTLARTNTPAYAIGWGSTVPSGGGYPKILQQVKAPIFSRADCNDANSYDGDVTARMICAGYANKKKDSCDGDSGGPLIVRDAQGRWRLQAGIVSWGPLPCAARNQPGVYSRLAVLSTWAKNVIARNASLVASLDCERLTGQGQRLCLQRQARE